MCESSFNFEMTTLELAAALPFELNVPRFYCESISKLFEMQIRMYRNRTLRLYNPKTIDSERSSTKNITEFARFARKKCSSYSCRQV